MTIIITVISLCVLTPSAIFAQAKQSDQAQRFKYQIGFGALERTYSGGTGEHTFTFSPGWTAQLGAKLTKGLSARVEYAQAKSYSDSTASSRFAFGSDEINRVSALKSQSVILSLSYYPLSNESSFSPFFGLGIGFDTWKMQDPKTGETLDTLGENNTRTAFETSEFVYGGFVGAQKKLSSRLTLSIEGQALNYSGAGAEFPAIVNDSRPDRALSLSIGLSMSFGSRTTEERFNSDQSWNNRANDQSSQDNQGDGSNSVGRDSDGDGIPDTRDRCSATPRGAEVNSLGCPLDSDGDGVFDGLDDCPKTPATALGLVDIYGCPIDADFDGVPDFRDDCQGSSVGSVVNQRGCAVDSDSDGVADGLDDCPATPMGILVDKFGCPDMSYFARPMVLNIMYPSGSYEVDAPSEARLVELATMLKSANSVSLQIYGYSDNIGSAEANRTLSQKRANRVRDYLVRNGVASERITVQGRGETNFVASNKTSAGRQKNRRIEIVFVRK